MRNHLRRHTVLGYLRISLPLVLMFMAGCQESTGRGVLVVRDQRAALLAANLSGRINMFGNLRGTLRMPYFTRAAISLQQHTFTGVGEDLDADLDTSGKRMVFSSTRHNLSPDLYLKQVHGVAVTQLTSDPASDVQPVFSPDGTSVAFASDRNGTWDIWVIGVDGGSPVQITEGLGDDLHPSWSPDGGRIVFCRRPTRAQQWELWIADAESGASRKFIGYGLFPDWSPVGDTILFQRARERGTRWFSIWTLTLVGGEPKHPTELLSSAEDALTLPAWSSDGQRVAFVRIALMPAGLGRRGISDVWFVYADGHGAVRLTDGHSGSHSPVFSSDGRIYFTSDRAGRQNIWSVLPDFPPGGNAGADVVTEGSRGENDSTRPTASAVSLLRGG